MRQEDALDEAAKRSAKAYARELAKVVEASDVVLEVLDARDPAGSRSSRVESAVRRAPGKRLVLVLNKVDLVGEGELAALEARLAAMSTPEDASRRTPAPILRCSYANAPLELMLDTEIFDVSAAAGAAPTPLPPAVRGTTHRGLVHICDWCELLLRRRRRSVGSSRAPPAS